MCGGFTPTSPSVPGATAETPGSPPVPPPGCTLLAEGVEAGPRGFLVGHSAWGPGPLGGCRGMLLGYSGRRASGRAGERPPVPLTGDLGVPPPCSKPGSPAKPRLLTLPPPPLVPRPLQRSSGLLSCPAHPAAHPGPLWPGKMESQVWLGTPPSAASRTGPQLSGLRGPGAPVRGFTLPHGGVLAEGPGLLHTPGCAAHAG